MAAMAYSGIAAHGRLIEQLLDLSKTSEDDHLGRRCRRAPAPYRAGLIGRRRFERDRCCGAGSTSAEVEGRGGRWDPAQLGRCCSESGRERAQYTPPGAWSMSGRPFDGAPAIRVIDDDPASRLASANASSTASTEPESNASADSGSGLGLAIVKAIAERHRASVTLHGGRGPAGRARGGVSQPRTRPTGPEGSGPPRQRRSFISRSRRAVQTRVRRTRASAAGTSSSAATPTTARVRR